MVSEPASPEPESGYGSPRKADVTTILIACAIGLAAILGVWMLILGGILIDPEPAPEPGASSSESVAGRPDDPDQCRRLAIEVWTRYVEATDMEDKAREVKDPDRVLPLMQDYYERRSHPFLSMADVSAGEIAASAVREALIFVVEPFSGPEYAVALEWIDGRYRIDWESLVAYGTADWYELTEGKTGDIERMRVFLSPLKERWQNPAMAPGAVGYLMEHRDYPDPVVAVSLAPESERVDPRVTGPRTPLRVAVRWDAELEAFRIIGIPEVGWSD
ncbi:hypothetical protein HAHE_17550 [Haloferula helveola]|uniref:Uncharacterized protein n=1 Tax=Haloferula helveola TaxID=490095 RepID=A0ABM7RF11_9BACT|nr:hypothetical protein HAHE_17550 [Haloferula helveola]